MTYSLMQETSELGNYCLQMNVSFYPLHHSSFVCILHYFGNLNCFCIKISLKAYISKFSLTDQELKECRTLNNESAWLLSDRVLDLGMRGCGFEHHQRHWVVIEQDSVYPLLSAGSN